MAGLSEQEIIRRDKLAKLRALGIDPYPAPLYPVDHTSADIKATFSEGKKVVIAGRLMSRRIQGKASFAELQDSKGRIQVYFNRDEICTGEDKTLYNEVYKKLLDIGDIIGIEGTLFTTKVGEQTVQVSHFSVLNKTLRPLPLPKTDADGNSYDEFNDPELRYRQRYVDLIVNPKVKDTFIKRTKITNSIRSFFNEREYLEVETPILQPIPGGASARPFITHHNALDIPLYLRIANELYLKRLIVGGFDGVYEFSKDFRNEGTTEALLEKVAVESNGTSAVTVGENTIDFKAPYPRVPILEAIRIHTGIDVSDMEEEELRATAKSLGLEVDETMGVGKLIDEIFGEKCEHHYIQPTFITDYPKEMSPLTKEHRDNKRLTERFELMVNGKELANAYSELNDPIDQRERFEDQLKLSEKGDDEAMFIDQDFLRALVQEVLFFPQMRPEKKAVELTEEEKSIFDLLKKTNPIALDNLKEQAGLSNKKWDKALKGLAKKGLTKVEKNEEGLWVNLN